MKIRKLYDEVLTKSIELSSALAKLGNRASEIYGKNLIADLCGDGEIEFRLSDYDNPNSTGENTFCVETAIEELEKMENKK